MQNNIIEFQLKGSRYVEPSRLVYALLVEPGEQQDATVERIQKEAAGFQLKSVSISENLPIRTAPHSEMDYILVYEFDSSAHLRSFLEAIKEVYGLSGGVIHLESKGEEEEEIKLIAELLEKAKQKAARLADLMGKRVEEVSGMQVDSGPFNPWMAFPSHQKIDRRFVMTAISMQYSRETYDQIELERKVTFRFRISQDSKGVGQL